jgi:hypothetical protein
MVYGLTSATEAPIGACVPCCYCLILSIGFQGAGFGVFEGETIVNDCCYGSGIDLFGRSPGGGLLPFFGLYFLDLLNNYGETDYRTDMSSIFFRMNSVY